MADEVKEYPGFPRRVLHDSFNVDNGYDIPADELLAALSEALEKQVPKAHRANATIYGPDEDGSDWGLKWWHYESDESYEHRWAKEQERVKALHAKLNADHARYSAVLKGNGSVRSKMNAAHKLSYTLSRMEEAGCPNP